MPYGEDEHDKNAEIDSPPNQRHPIEVDESDMIARTIDARSPSARFLSCTYMVSRLAGQLGQRGGGQRANVRASVVSHGGLQGGPDT